MEYLDRRPADQPFFMWLSVPDPHPPYMVCEPYASMYDDVEMPKPHWRDGEMDNKPYRQRCLVEADMMGVHYPGDDFARLMRTYWGMVSCIDDQVGRLMSVIRAHGLEENTVIIFTSDHGDYMGDHRLIRKGPTLYESLTHVPMIAHCPGQISAKKTDAMISNIDILPTICELAGVDVPGGVQGISFANVLRGEADQHRDMVFMEHGQPGKPLQPGMLSDEQQAAFRSSPHQLESPLIEGKTKAVRTDRWKYCYTPGDIDELYDLYSDPHELTNLADMPQYASVILELRQAILDWLIETEDKPRV
jgi:arylsulfatase A-like enzyme